MASGTGLSPGELAVVSFSVIAALAALALAVAVFLAGRTRSVNRRLAVLLGLEGIAQTVALGGVVGGGAAQAVIDLVHVTALLALPFAYVLFIASFRTPLVRPLRWRGAQALLLGVALSVQAYWLWHAPEFWAAHNGADWTPPPFLALLLERMLIPLFALVSLLGLGAALAAYARARNTHGARAQARAYVLAFGAHDTLYAVFFGLAWGASATAAVAEALGSGAVLTLMGLLPPVATLLFALGMTYGILRTQLFDIDIRTKVVLSQSTVAGVFAVAFFVVSEGIEQLLDVNGALYGIAAAGGVVLALRPLQRWAERLTERVLPGAAGAPDDLHARKLDVYRATMEDIMEDGLVTPKERAVLDGLRARLGIADAEADAIERDVAARSAAPSLVAA